MSFSGEIKRKIKSIGRNYKKKCFHEVHLTIAIQYSDENSYLSHHIIDSILQI